MKNIYSQIPERAKENAPLVLATVISTSGSTPQKAGASALFDSDGLKAGTIGGGYLEGKVSELAIEAAKNGKSGIYHFELDKSIEHKSEAICGGRVRVLIESGAEKYIPLVRLVENNLKKRKPVVILTEISAISDNSLQIRRSVFSKADTENLSSELLKRIRPELVSLLDDSSAGSFITIDPGNQEETGKDILLLESLIPLPLLVIAGAGHIGKALSHLGKMIDFEVIVIDDRPEFANHVNIPDADHLIIQDIGAAIGQLKPGRDTYVVIVTRGHNDDAEALKACIGSEAFYVGMIGSKTKVEKMRKNFIENGWATEDQWKAIHTPVGIGINAKSVEEIAVSIAAELIMAKNSGNK